MSPVFFDSPANNNNVAHAVGHARATHSPPPQAAFSQSPYGSTGSSQVSSSHSHGSASAAMFAEHQMQYEAQARYYQQQQQRLMQLQQQQQASPKHFKFNTSSSSSQSLSSPHTPTAANQAEADADAEHHETNSKICQDERDGLSLLLSCSLISPKEGDERNDVLEEEDETLFLFSEEEDNDQEKKKEEDVKTASSPSTDEKIATSFSPKEKKNEEKKNVLAVSPVSLVDDGTIDDEPTDEDTAGEGTLDTSIESKSLITMEEETAQVNIDEDAPLLPALASSKKKPKKSVTIREDDEIHEYIPPTPINSSTPKSLLEQAQQQQQQQQQRGSGSASASGNTTHKSHKSEMVDMIPDDESEASMLVLMRYIGCTAQTYGEQKPLPTNVDLDHHHRRHHKEFLVASDSSDDDDDDDDDTTLSGWTAESSLLLNIATSTTNNNDNSTDGGCYYEEGGEEIELLLEEHLPPSMRLVRSVSLDEGMDLQMEGDGGDEKMVGLATSQSDPTPSDEMSVEDEKSSKVDPVAAATKAVQVALTPQGSGGETSSVNGKTRKTSTSNKASNKKPHPPLPKQKPNITVNIDRPPKKTPLEPEEVSSHSSQDSPASVARAFLAAASSDSAKAKELGEEKTSGTSPSSPKAKKVIVKEPVVEKVSTSPSLETKKVIVKEPVVDKVKKVLAKEPEVEKAQVTTPSSEAKKFLGSATKNDGTKPTSPASKAKAYLAPPPKTEPKSIASQEKKPKVSDALPKKTSMVEAKPSPKQAKKKYPVDDLIQAYLSQPRDAHVDQEMLMAAISPSALKSPSVQMLLQSNILSSLPVPKSEPSRSQLPTPRVNNTSDSMKVTPSSSVLKVDLPKKKVQPSGVSMQNKEHTASSTMTPLEKKLSKGKLPSPVQTEDNIHVDKDNDVLSPVSAISEGTLDTMDTEALISMARKTSSSTRRTLSSRSTGTIPTITEAPDDASKASGSTETTVTFTSKPAVITNDATTITKPVLTKSKAPDTKVQSNEKKTQTKVTTKKLGKDCEENKVLRTNTIHHVNECPQESSSFDKNEVTKDTKRAAVPESDTSENRAQITALTSEAVSSEECGRDPPPSLTPCRKSVREVDELLSKTRAWLAHHSATQTTNASSCERSSLLSRQVDLQRKTVRNLASPANTETSIREELAALKARQDRSVRARQNASKTLGV